MKPTLETFVQTIEAVDTLIRNYQRFRDQSTAEEWDEACDHPLLSAVIDSLSDLEYLVDR